MLAQAPLRSFSSQTLSSLEITPSRFLLQAAYRMEPAVLEAESILPVSWVVELVHLLNQLVLSFSKPTTSTNTIKYTMDMWMRAVMPSAPELPFHPAPGKQ